MAADPVIIVSSDGHVHPALATDYWDYCPADLREDFEAYAKKHSPETLGVNDVILVPNVGELFPEDVQQEFVTRAQTPGYRDATRRLADMDDQGIAVEVMFHGGGGFGPMPFQTEEDPVLRSAGVRMFNRWLADFVAQGGGRFIGVAQLPFWSIDEMVDEVRWATDNGLRTVSFPAPRSNMPYYSDPAWDPFWAVCEERDVPLNCHSGSGEYPPPKGESGIAIFLAELHWIGRRALPYMIFGKVFERFPGLKLVFTEQRGGWVPSTLDNLDAVFESPVSGASTYLPKRPSEYWASNCFLANSFMARFEVEMRDEVGVDRIMWGADYPHIEGTWPWTRQSMRYTFAGLPRIEIKAMLGENAMRCYSLDRAELEKIAALVGPSMDEVDSPLEEIPEAALAVPTLGFRQLGEYH